DIGKDTIDLIYFEELLLDKKFLFKVKVKRGRWSVSYDVSKINADPILAKWRATQGPVQSPIPLNRYFASVEPLPC
ncbi:hypothetical protein PIB30_080598, partial [Stylosanthes scabra]|nr:hypothetical protein [Stylosanthes scabra]